MYQSSPNRLIFTSQPQPVPNLLDPQQSRSYLIATSPAKPKIISTPIARSIFTPPSQIHPNSSLSYNSSYICPQHPNERARRICASINCNKRVLLCEECMLEDPEHVKMHRNHIMLIPDFLNKIDDFQRKKGPVNNSLLLNRSRNIESVINEQAKELAYNSEKYLISLKTQITKEKLKIAADFQNILKQVTEHIERAKEKLLKDLDDYYESIQEYSEELKNKVFHGNISAYAGDPIFDFQNINKNVVISRLNELKDERMIEDYIRKLRDFMFSHNEFESILPAEDNISLEMTTLMADKLRKIYNNPPLYKESSHGHKIYNTLISKIPSFAEELYTNLKDAMTFIFIDESQKLFFDSVTKDHKSCQLSQQNQFNLVQNSYIKTGHSKQINCLAVVEDKLATGSSDSQIMIWSLDTGEHISTFQGHKGPIVSLSSMTMIDKQGVASIQSETYLASGSCDKNIILWNMQDENDTIALKGHDDAITCLLDVLDGRNLISGSADRRIIVWDVLKGKILTILPCNGSIYYLHLMKDASKFISCDYSQALNIWKIEYTRSEGSNVVAKVLLEKVFITKCRVISLNSGYANTNLIVGGCEDKVIRYILICYFYRTIDDFLI